LGDDQGFDRCSPFSFDRFYTPVFQPFFLLRLFWVFVFAGMEQRGSGPPFLEVIILDLAPLCGTVPKLDKSLCARGLVFLFVRKGRTLLSPSPYCLQFDCVSHAAPQFTLAGPLLPFFRQFLTSCFVSFLFGGRRRLRLLDHFEPELSLKIEAAVCF